MIVLFFANQTHYNGVEIYNGVAGVRNLLKEKKCIRLDRSSIRRKHPFFPVIIPLMRQKHMLIQFSSR
jgi:hypothetical protein